MAFIVYWARLKHHDDPYSEGYVGISHNTLDERKRSHYKTAKSKKRRNVHFHNALLKYGGDVIWETLHENLSEDDAFDLEGEYRPDINVGWNTDKGGIKAVSPEWYATKQTEKHRQATAEATRKRIAEVDSPEARAARAREIWSTKNIIKHAKACLQAKITRNTVSSEKITLDMVIQKQGRAAISAAMAGRYVSPETRAKIAEARSNVTDEVRAECTRDG